jgi:hypothetical protein
MVMKQSGHRPGGGIASRQHVETPVRTGSGSHNARPAGVAQLGYPIGDHSTTSGKSTGYRGEPLHGPASRNFQPVLFGNQVALNVKGGGPGTGRDVHATGSQGLHGSGGPQKPAGRDFLSGFGPESKRR